MEPSSKACASAATASTGVPVAAGSKPLAPDSNISEAMVDSIGNVLESISKMHLQKPYQESAFSAKAPPAISIKNYIKRSCSRDIGIFKYLYCSQPVLIVTLILIDRFQERNP